MLTVLCTNTDVVVVITGLEDGQQWSLRRSASVDIAVSTVAEESYVAAYWIKLQGLVRQRTIPTERPPLVGEVSANFRG
jgi:hypothetical protein